MAVSGKRTSGSARIERRRKPDSDLGSIHPGADGDKSGSDSRGSKKKVKRHGDKSEAREKKGSDSLHEGKSRRDKDDGKVHELGYHPPSEARIKTEIKESPVALNDLTFPKKGFGCDNCFLFPYHKDYKGNMACKYAGHRITTHMISGWGFGNPEVLFIGEAPGYNEDMSGHAFVETASAGGILHATLSEAGFKDGDAPRIRLDNILLCRPPDNKAPTFNELMPCSGFLGAKIAKMKPRLIVPLGGTALKALTGNPKIKISDHIGVPMTVTVAGVSTTLIPMWHPQYIGYNTHLRGEYVDSFRKLLKFASSNTMSVERKEGKWKVLTDFDEVKELFERFLAEKKPVAFDVETNTLDPTEKGAIITVFGISNTVGEGYSIPLMHPDNPMSAEERKQVEWYLKELLNHYKNEIPIVMQNGKFDIKFIRMLLGFKVNGFKYDTMLAHTCIDERVAHALGSLSIRYTDVPDYWTAVEDEARTNGGGWGSVPIEMLGKYNAADVDVTLRLFYKFRKELKNEPGLRWVSEVLLPAASKYITDMECAGAKFDSVFSKCLAKKLETDVDNSLLSVMTVPQLRKYIRKKTVKNPKFKFSLASPKQLDEFLFGVMDYDPISKTKGGANSTDVQTLLYLRDRYKSEIIDDILKYRSSKKLLSTYVEPLLERESNSSKKGYVFGSFNLHTVVTGRLSSSNPNLQNIPNTSAGVIKRQYVSRFKDGFLLAADYSQIELRILAALSGDEEMIRVYKKGEDLHKRTCCMIFGMSEKGYDKLNKEEQKRRRTIAKRINFGIAYGIGADGIMSSLASENPPVIIDENEARRYIKAFYRAYPDVDRWIKRTQSECERDLYCDSPFGRRRRLSEVESLNEEDVARALRQGVNHKVQSPASDMMLMAGITINKGIRKRKMRSRVFITVHDQILTDTMKEESAFLYQLVKSSMERVWEGAVAKDKSQWAWLLGSGVPIVADVEVGYSWRDLVGVNSVDEIKDALVKSREELEIRDTEVFA